MANFKVVISDPSSKKAFQKEVEAAQSGLVSKKIGEKVSGNNIGLDGYELEITGGSDKDGFPMRKDVNGTVRKKIILTSPPGYHPSHFGKRKRKSIRGNIVSQDISQVNLKVVKAGSKKLGDILGKKEDEGDKKAEDKSVEKVAEKPKEEAKTEKPAEKKEEPKADEKPKEKKGPAKTEQAESNEAAKAGEEKGSSSQPDQAAKAESKMGVKPLEK